MTEIAEETIYIVTAGDNGNVARMRNPYNPDPPYNIDDKSDCQRASDCRINHLEFKDKADRNQFYTDAEPGEYKLSEFGEEVWQYQSKSVAGENLGKWFMVDNYIYENAYKNSIYNTRRFRSLLPKEETCSTCGYDFESSDHRQLCINNHLTMSEETEKGDVVKSAEDVLLSDIAEKGFAYIELSYLTRSQEFKDGFAHGYYNGSVDKSASLQSRIDELEKENEKLKRQRLILSNGGM